VQHAAQFGGRSATLQGYLAMTFVIEAITKAQATDSGAIAKALGGLTVSTPLGTLTMHAERRSVNRGLFFGPVIARRDGRGIGPGAVYVNDVE
jgi:hypothetical protein